MNTQFAPNDKILFIDFDHTCYNTDMFLLAEISQPMLKRFNLPQKEWEISYENAVKAGYTLEQHLKEINKIIQPAPCSDTEIKEFGKIINFDKYLYDDTIPFLKEAKEKGYKIMLLSFGSPKWQNKKVLSVGLEKFIDVIKYTKEEGSKIEVLRQFTNHNGKTIFVDNNGIDLDAAKKELPNIETYYINRAHDDLINKEDIEYMRIRYMESRKIAERTLFFPHKKYTNLKEITL